MRRQDRNGDRPPSICRIVDALDIGIIDAMGIYPYGHTTNPPERLRPSYIARKLRTSLNTVKARVARMEEEGIIAGYQVTPNFAHLGVRPTAWMFHVTDADRGAVTGKEIAKEAGLLEVHDYLGHGLCLVFAYEDDDGLRRRLDGFSRHTGDPRPLLFYDWRMPPVERPLSTLDWRIVQALRWNARASPYDIADRLGVTGSTVQRRLDRMVQEQSVAFTVLFDASKVSGLLVFDLLVYLERSGDTAAVGRVLKAVEGVTVSQYVPASEELGNYGVLCFTTTPADAEAVRQLVSRIEGVRRADLWLLRDVQVHGGWIDDFIAERAGAAVPA